MCGQTTCDVVLTAYCDKCVKRIYENTPFPGTREKSEMYEIMEMHSSDAAENALKSG